MRLTKRTVEAAKAAEREVFLWDDGLPGFGLRISPSGKRGYVIQYRAKGRTRRLALGLHGVLTAEQARRTASELLSTVRRGADPSAERNAARSAPTVAELCERYLTDYAEGRKKASSFREDRRIADRHVIPALGQRRVADVEQADVLHVHNALRETPIMANRVLAMLSTAFREAERWGLRPIGTNPCRGVARYREHMRERFLSESELAKLGDALTTAEQTGAESSAVIAVLRLLTLTGCRVSEIRTLHWTEVDFERACLRLRDSKTGPKVVQLNTPALEVLARLAERRRSEWVFPARDGKRPIWALASAWNRIRRSAGFPDLRMHDLRHSFASVGACSGQSLLVIGALLGHRLAATTQRYAHLSNDPIKSASEAIGARIAAAMSGAPRAAVTALRREGEAATR